MELLGDHAPILTPLETVGAGVVAVVAAAALLELSRSLAAAYRGRWFAGNGRDVFHAAAVAAVGAAMLAAGLSPGLSAIAAATVVALPLVLLDDLPPRRGARFGILLALFAAGTLPALLAPGLLVGAANATARALFP